MTGQTVSQEAQTGCIKRPHGKDAWPGPGVQFSQAEVPDRREKGPAGSPSLSRLLCEMWSKLSP